MQESPRPQINASKIVVGSGVGGAIFTIGSMLIFLAGLPVLWYLFPAAILLGALFAVVRRVLRRQAPGAPWILAAIEQQPAPPECRGNRPDSARILAVYA